MTSPRFNIQLNSIEKTNNDIILHGTLSKTPCDIIIQTIHNNIHSIAGKYYINHPKLSWTSDGKSSANIEQIEHCFLYTQNLESQQLPHHDIYTTIDQKDIPHVESILHDILEHVTDPHVHHMRQLIFHIIKYLSYHHHSAPDTNLPPYPYTDIHGYTIDWPHYTEICTQLSSKHLRYNLQYNAWCEQLFSQQEIANYRPGSTWLADTSTLCVKSWKEIQLIAKKLNFPHLPIISKKQTTPP